MDWTVVDNGTQTGDAGSFTPNTNGSTNVCEEDEKGNCLDEANGASTLNLATTTYDFGINEIDAVECISWSIGKSFSAEIDKANSDEVDGTYQFALLTSSGDYSQDRIDGTNELSVCYMRGAVGSHKGQIKLLVNASSSSSSSAYAYILSFNGQTLDVLINVSSPAENEIFYQCPSGAPSTCSDQNEGMDDEEGDLLFTASGSANMDMLSIMANGLDTPVVIDVDGVKYGTKFDSSGNFSQVVGVSKVSGEYNVSFSVEINKSIASGDNTLTKTIPIVVASKPKLEIEVRDENGTLVDTSNPTDFANLIVGFKVSNLNTSGPSESELPVDIFDLRWNDAEVEEWDDTTLWNSGSSWCMNEDGDSYPGFEEGFTYCLPLGNITTIQKGLNTISAKAKNALGEISAETFFIADNDKPIITFTSPVDDQLLSSASGSETYSITISPTGEVSGYVTLTGTVKNFAPLSVHAGAPDVVSGDVGSYCQVKSDDEDTACPTSSVKLWFNTSTLNYPIYIYPDLPSEYASSTLSDINSSIAENADTSSNCYTTSNSTTLLDGDSTQTSVDSNGNITTNVTDAAGNVTSTYTTDTSGNVTETITADETETDHISIDANDSHSSAAKDEDGNIVSSVYDPETDITTTTETDATTGEITQTVDQRICNVSEGAFSIKLQIPSEFHHATLNLYTNIIEMQAESVSGHRTIQVVPFFVGETNRQSRNQMKSSTNIMKSRKLTAGPLGFVDEDNCEMSSSSSCVDRAPLMLYVSEGTIDRNTTEGAKIIKVVEKFLNENFSFADLANGWPLPEDEDGNVDMMLHYREQYQEENDGESFKWLTDLSDPWQEKFIWQGIHSMSMAEKFMALINLRTYQMLNNDCDYNAPENCFFDMDGDPYDDKWGYKVAKDACDETITTAFVPLGDLHHIAEAEYGATANIPLEGEWPDIAGVDTHFNDFIQGKWKIQKLDFKNNGFIDADVCLVPDDPDNQNYTTEIEDKGCDADVSLARTPAFWGHFTAYDLIKGGLLGGPGLDDLTIPLIWSVGKVRVKLEDILAIKKKLVTIDGKNTWTNYLQINLSPSIPETIPVDVTDLEWNEENNSISIAPFAHCDDYYEDEYNKYRNQHKENDGITIPEYDPEEDLPFGCNPNHDKGQANYPFILERTSDTGMELYASPYIQNGKDTSLLAMVWQGVVDTFKKIVGCMDTEMINPAINSQVFPFPPWVSKENQLSTDFEWEFFNFTANASQSDLSVKDGGLTVRLPLTLGVDNVTNLGERTSQLANRHGHLIRTTKENTLHEYTYPLQANDPHTQAFAGISLNLEEFVNAGSFLLFKKGPFNQTLMDALDITEITPNTAWEIGWDKVVACQAFDIADYAGLLSADLPANIIFTASSSIFDYPNVHLDIILNRNSPVTISLNKIKDATMVNDDGTTENVDLGFEATEIKLGITNVQVSVKEMIPYENGGDSDVEIYEDPENVPEKIRLRLDAVLSLKAIYHQSERKFNVFVEDLNKQNIHIEVLNGGPTYDDINLTTDIMNYILPSLFSKLEKSFDASSNADATIVVTLAGMAGNEDGAISAVNLNDMEFTVNMDAPDNKTCGDNVPLYESQYDKPGSHPHAKKSGSNYGNNHPKQDAVPFTEMNGEINTDPFSVCSMFTSRTVLDENGVIVKDDNPIEEALCDLGIEDVYLTPTIYFDSENGYIHLSTDLIMELMDSMK